MNAIPCRVEGCDHPPLKNAKAERMHFHRAHSRTIIPFREKPAKRARLKIGTTTGKPDRRTKEWRMRHPHQAKPLGSRGQPRQNIVDRALAHFAEPSTSLECPNCHYDFNLLTTSRVPNRVCPGCGTPFQTFIDRLTAIAKA